MKTERNHRTTAQSAGADTIRLRQIRKNCKDRMPPLYVPIRRSEALTEHNSGCKQRNRISRGFILINPTGAADAAKGRNENCPQYFYMIYSYLQ